MNFSIIKSKHDFNCITDWGKREIDFEYKQYVDKRDKELEDNPQSKESISERTYTKMFSDPRSLTGRGKL